MTDIRLIRAGSGLLPYDEEAREVIAKWPRGTFVLADVRRPRNAAFHRKFFALLNLAHESQEMFPTLEALRFYCTVKAGFFDAVETRKGTMVLPRSISFAKMDEDEFSRLYARVIDVLVRDVLPDGWTGEELAQRVDEILEFAA